jgi:hypothetical protein
MSPATETQATVQCPLENTTVDVERCAGCYWRSQASITCNGSDRTQANDWRRILRALST